MHKIGIIGLGHVGTTVAHILLMKGLADELILIDQNEKKVAAEYNDFGDSFPRTNHSAVIKQNDYNELADADIVITAFGDIEATNRTGDRFAELPINKKNAREVGAKIKGSGFNGILINISNPCDAVLGVLQKATGLPYDRIFGTGTSLDTARMQRAIGTNFHEAPQNVDGYVLGEHGNTQFTAWSTIHLDGIPVTKLADEGKVDLDQLATAIRNGAFTIMAGKGYTCFGVATCAAQLVEAVFTDKHLFGPVSVYMQKYGCYIGYPAVIGAHGIEDIHEIKLTAEEEDLLAKSAETIKEKTKD
ncbi:L-lactate dehydrogenase [Limosilactobacillus kribbianus]|uniref:L-lactate dehydrogenase n=1 Tax=Limosilactobacillus kribbianus TaxID=2982695 RepID=UPI00226480E2|nr:L-lactate dehydrogenase [Limosilactobacillus kribbianus]